MHLSRPRFFLSLCLLVPLFVLTACNSGTGSDSSAMGSDAALLMALTQGRPTPPLSWGLHVEHVGSAWTSSSNDGNLVLTDEDRASFEVALSGELAGPYTYQWEVYPKTSQGFSGNQDFTPSPPSQIVSPRAAQTIIGFPFTGSYAYTLTATDVQGRSASVLFRVHVQGHDEPHVAVGRVLDGNGAFTSLPNGVQIRFALYDAGQGISDEVVIREASSDFDGEFYVEGLINARANYRVVLPSAYTLDTAYFADPNGWDSIGDANDWVPDAGTPRWGFIPWADWQIYLLANDG